MAVKYSRKDSSGHTNYYDEHGKKVGYSYKDPGLSGTTSYYDEHDKKTGESKEGLFGDIFNIFKK